MLSFLKVYPSFSSCNSCVAVFLRRVLAFSYEILELDGGFDSLLPSFAKWSEVSFPVIPEYDGIHWRTIFLFFFFDSFLSCLHKVVVVLSVGFDCRV